MKNRHEPRALLVEERAPVMSGDAQPAITRRETIPTPAASAPTVAPQDLVLVVDDSPTIRALLEVSLKLAGYACHSFADGASMLRWLWQDAPRLACLPRLLVLDLELPGMDGYAIAHTIRANARWQEIALVMLTGRDGVTDRLKGCLAGAQAYLTKPFRIEHLLSTVRTVLAGSPPAVQGDDKRRA